MARQSLQHDVFEVLLQNCVFDGVKDKADVFCVHCGGEVVEQRLPPVSPLAAERLHQERLEEAEDPLELQTKIRPHQLLTRVTRTDITLPWDCSEYPNTLIFTISSRKFEYTYLQHSSLLINNLCKSSKV